MQVDAISWKGGGKDGKKGGGKSGKDPLIFQTNGSPYRGFLDGRINKNQYQLIK